MEINGEILEIDIMDGRFKSTTMKYLNTHELIRGPSLLDKSVYEPRFLRDYISQEITLRVEKNMKK